MTMPYVDRKRGTECIATYYYALALVQLLAQRVDDRSRYCYIGGRRCHTLDEAVRALLEPNESKFSEQRKIR